jgi:hypothetical protein
LVQSAKLVCAARQGLQVLTAQRAHLVLAKLV